MRDHRQKRGGGKVIISLDDESAENRYALEPVDRLSAQKLYERRWAMALLDRALARLGEECTNGKAELFERVKGLLSGGSADQRYPELAAELGISHGAIRVAIHRLRVRYGELLREEIAQTVGSEAEVDGEIRCLFAALSDQ